MTNDSELGIKCLKKWAPVTLKMDRLHIVCLGGPSSHINATASCYGNRRVFGDGRE